MKKILITVLAVCASSVFAQPEKLATLVCSGVTTSEVAVTATSPVYSAYINSLKIVVSDEKTCTVTVSAGDTTLYSSAAATGTLTIYPVVQNSTNGTVVASFSKAFLASEALTVSASTITDSNSASVSVTAVLERLP